MLRRSSRVSASVKLDNGQIATITTEATTKTKKRGRKSNVFTNAENDTTIQSQRKANETLAMPPPMTPNKRRRKAEPERKPPPATPTPSAIGLMISSSPFPAVTRNYSTGDVDDDSPPASETLAEPHHTNATLVDPEGTKVRPPNSLRADDTAAFSGGEHVQASDLLDTACAHLLKQDPALKPVIDQHSCRIFSAAGLAEEIDPFRSLASGIMAQQVSGAAAKSIKGKFIGLFPPQSCPTGFPSPSLVAQTSIPRLREAGLSQRKAEYIQGLANKFDTGELTVEMLMEGSDEEVMKKLVAVRGLGAWSVEMFMCFGLKRMDVFSTGDLGVQRGMAAYVGRDVKKLKAKGGGKWKYMSEKDMLETAEKFRPYRSLFMWYMWRIESVDVDAIQDN